MVEPLTQRGDPLSPAALSGEFKVLGSSPAWMEVERAIAALDGRATTDPHTRDEHIGIVGDYAQLLKSRTRVLWQAIQCGVLVGRLAGEERFADALHGGLVALQRSCGFDSSTAVATFDRLAEDAVRDFAQFVASTAKEPPPPLTADAIPDWYAWCTRVNTATHSATFHDVNGDEMRKRAWAGWEQRIKRHFAAAEQAPALGIADACCELRGVSPVNLLSEPLERMTLRQWSACLIAATGRNPENDPRYAPRWLGFAAAVKLKLGRNILGSMASEPTEPTPPADENLVEWRKLAESRMPVGLPIVVLATQPDSPTETWSIGSRVGSYSARPAEVANIKGAGWQLDSNKNAYIAVEKPTAEQMSDLVEMMKGADAPRPFQLVDAPPTHDAQIPYIITASVRGVDELHRAMLERLAPAPPPQTK